MEIEKRRKKKKEEEKRELEFYLSILEILILISPFLHQMKYFFLFFL